MATPKGDNKKLFFHPSTKSGAGFTLIELLVVIAIIGLLASVVLVALNGARTKAKVAVAAQNQRQLQKAIELYYNDVGFYPPDTGRGADPGFSKALPYNADPGYSFDCNTAPDTCPTACPQPQCPVDWIAQVQAKWRGPYIAKWPNTPWNGKVDYNYWAAGAVRYGCTIPPGIYIGMQGDYSDANMIPADAEQQLLDKKLDSDGCLDGESEMILIGL